MVFKNSVLGLFSVFFGILSCSSDETDGLIEGTLASAIQGRETVSGNVIACAASNEDSPVVSVFLYPREGASNINFYVTESTGVDKDDFSAYTKGDANLIDVFNGFLQKYEISSEQEKWVIVTFEEDGKVHLSNPIRLKQNTKPTEYLPQNVSVEASTNMPVFSWQDGTFDDSTIYFEVVSDANNNLLSGTYTFERIFQYYKLENVVLNITQETPPVLEAGMAYNFSLLAVSEDNWVNLFSEIGFSLE